jgi:prephenate dehydrogenase
VQTVAIAGVGLIGTSFGLALRDAGFQGRILGVSSPRSISAGCEAGAIDSGASLEEAAADSDLIYLSQPIEEILATIVRLGPLVRPECLVTDAGSTKSLIVQTAQKHLPPSVFLGGHPMAGKEKRGAHAAEAGLFRGRPYVLTGSSHARVPEFRTWLERIGAQLIDMSPEEHDQTVAFTSHLPQLLSTALAVTLHGEDPPRVFGPGLIDMTRLALSSPDVWMSVLETNAPQVDAAIAAFEKTLAEIRMRLRSGQVIELFERGSDLARRVRETSNKNRAGT